MYNVCLIKKKKKLKMNKPKSNNNVSKKQDDCGHYKKHEHVANPTLYSSIIQTESKLRNISLSHLKPNSIPKKVIFVL